MLSLPRPFLPRLRRAAAARRGTAAMEFGLIAPILIAVMLAVVDIGGAIQQNIRLEAAARSALGYAHLYSDNTNAIRNYVISALNGWNDVTVENVTMTCACGTTANNVTTWGNNVACPATCTSGEEQRRMIAINVSRSYNGIIYLQNRTLRGDVQLRVQ